MNADQIGALWATESASYRTREVGSGVQRFVRECLKCDELFDLQPGNLSTPLERRTREFIEEKNTRGARTADIVIYTAAGMPVPVEVEKYGDIEAGVGQIAQYQLDLGQKLGILTDGHEWRFYNNRRYESLTLTNFLQSPVVLRAFWQTYTAPLYYYRSFFNSELQHPAANALSLAEGGNIPDSFEGSSALTPTEVRHHFFDDIRTLIEHLSGSFMRSEATQPSEARRQVEIAYAYLIQYLLYKSLVDNQYADYYKANRSRLRAVAKALDNELYHEPLAAIQGISHSIANRIYRPFQREQEAIASSMRQLLDDPDVGLMDIAPWLDIFVFIHRYDFGNVEQDLFGYVYENYLNELFPKSERGQRFTDPAVVEFMLDEVGYRPKALRTTLRRGKEVSIVDPACGSGTFLMSATRRLVDALWREGDRSSVRTEDIVCESVFGLDVEEFPLYLAEMNQLSELLPVIADQEDPRPLGNRIKVFKTRDSISEFLNVDVLNTKVAAEVSASEQPDQTEMFDRAQMLDYASFVRDEGDLHEMKASLEAGPSTPRWRFDYVVANPPYVGYNACSQAGLLFFELMREGAATLSNVYGVNLHSAPGRRKKYPPKPNLYAFFVALGLALLKDGARLCYIIPQSLLTESNYDVLRYHLSTFVQVDSLIAFSGRLFVGRGLDQKRPIATSSLIITLTNRPPAADHEVEVVYHESDADDVSTVVEELRARRGSQSVKVRQELLRERIENWNFLAQPPEFQTFLSRYEESSADISCYYNHDQARVAFGSRFYFDVGYTLDTSRYHSEPTGPDDYAVLDHRDFVGLTQLQPSQYYPGGEDHIDLPRNSQGLDTIRQRYKIVWPVKNPDRFYLTDQRIVFPMGNSGIISSDNRAEIYFLFGVLNSTVCWYLLEGVGRIPNERSGFLVPITRIKESIRVPRVRSTDSEALKAALIGRVEDLVSMEARRFHDFVDMRAVRWSVIDSVGLDDGAVLLGRKNRSVRCKIRNDPKRVAEAVEQIATEIERSGEAIDLLRLRNYPATGGHERELVMRWIDELSFALFFNQSLGATALEDLDAVESSNAKDGLYAVIRMSRWADRIA